MPVQEQVPYTEYLGNGVSTVFAYTFKLFQVDDLRVTFDGVEQLGGYTVDGLGNDAGGNVTFTTAPASGVVVGLLLEVEMARTTDYIENGDLRAQVQDDDFDRIWEALQGLQWLFGGAIRVPYPETVQPLPKASSRVDRLLMFDEITGKPVLTDFTATEVASAIAAAYAGGGALDALGFIQAGFGAVPRSAQAKAREIFSPKDFGAKGDGVNDDTLALQRCFNAVPAGSWVLLNGMFRVTDPVTITNKGLVIMGQGQRNSGLMEDGGLTSGQYILNIVNTDFTQPVTLRDFSFFTTQASVCNALYVEFSAADAEFNRSPHHLVMRDIEIRGYELNGVGHPQDGFYKGVTLKNVHRPICDNVVITGQGGNPFLSTAPTTNTVMSMGWELLATYHPSDAFQRAAPTDPVFRDCHVYSANYGWYVRGHWEGLMFDHSIAVLVNKGWDLDADTPPGVGGTQFPWVAFTDCHANVFQEAIVIKDFFDIRMTKPQLHKWAYAPAAYVSNAIKLTNCPRVAIEQPTIVNLADGSVSTFQQFNGVYALNCLGVRVDKPQFSGITYGVIFDGTTTDAWYERGLWRDVPATGPAPIEFQNLASGTGRQKGMPFDVSAKNSGSVPVTNSVTNVVLGVAAPLPVWPGDVIQVEATIQGTKDANTEPVFARVVKQTGTATVQFHNDNTQVIASTIGQNSLAFNITISARARVTVAGSLTLALQCNTVANGATIAIGAGQLRLIRD